MQPYCVGRPRSLHALAVGPGPSAVGCIGIYLIDLPFGEPPPLLVFRLFLDRPSEIRLVMPEVLGILQLLGSVWRTLGSREELGAISCAVLGPMGVILATLWLHIGILSGSWGDFGPIWAPLGAHLATLWPLLAPFGQLLAAFWHHFGNFWLHLDHFWGPFASKNEGRTKTKKITPKREPKTCSR